MQSNFSKIPGSPIAYWVSEKLIMAFKGKNLADYAVCKSGIMTGSDNKFVRYWFEPNSKNINFNCSNSDYEISKEKWFPVNGGGFRKWYGNLDSVVNIRDNGCDIKNEPNNNFRLRNKEYYFREGAVWSEICTGTFSARYCKSNTLFFVTAPLAIPNIKTNYKYLLALMNSNISNYIFNIINPTLHYNIGCVESLPFIQNENTRVIELAEQNINISKQDWDSFETSWDFKKHPLV